MDSFVQLIIFIILIIVVCVIGYKVIRYYLKRKIETITAFTGGLGSGKTCLSVDLAKMLIKRNCRKLKRVIRHNRIRNTILFFLKPKNVVFDTPKLFSNIPIIVSKPSKVLNFFRRLLHLEEKKPIYSAVLTKEILLLQTSIPQGSVVLIDELSAWANQFMFKDKNIIEVNDEWVRLFRHYYSVVGTHIEPYLVVNDQCSENINLVIRRRLNMVHNLSNFMLIGPLAFYYERIISISEEIKTIDVRTGMENDTQDNSNFRWKVVFSRGSYDSHCYSERASRLPRLPINYFDKLKTNELLRCPTDAEHSYIALTGTPEEIKRRQDIINKNKRYNR